ncbi:MAG: SpoVR family protein [Proteobacteria bacterium]|nr:SpoVR family protein [Pseudomonadota bacterium]
MIYGTVLTPELQKLKGEIEAHAHGYGLDFFETIFEMIDYKQINEIASYGGFPTRYPHWRFGMDYDRLSKSYQFGLHKIYEMVINNDPCYAYLLNSNSMMDHKLVMAHVFAHCDFFKCNMHFFGSNRKMMDEMANHATKIRNYMDKHGIGVVEDFIDICLSIENLIDYYAINQEDAYKPIKSDEEGSKNKVYKIKSKQYMDKYINPEDFLKQQKERLDKKKEKSKKTPPEPVKDVLYFLQEQAPLETWQKDVLSIIREESYYFSPQGQTKIMNEGWASYWHSKIMTQKALRDSEVIDFADHHSGTVYMRPGSLNPYKLGLELFRDIEERWDKGQFGKDWDECDDYRVKKNWDKKLGVGKEKIFEVRRLYNDVTFIDTFLTPEFAEGFKLFTFDANKRTGQWEISSREFQKIKDKLLFSLTNFGQPFISVEDSNYKNRSELLLLHRYEGFDLKISEARRTMEGVYKIWKRPINVRTIIQGEKKILTYDGKEHTEENYD